MQVMSFIDEQRDRLGTFSTAGILKRLIAIYVTNRFESAGLRVDHRQPGADGAADFVNVDITGWKW